MRSVLIAIVLAAVSSAALAQYSDTDPRSNIYNNESLRRQDEIKRNEEAARRQSDQGQSSGGASVGSQYNAQTQADLKAARARLLKMAPLSDARNPLLGRWRVEGAARSRKKDDMSTLMGMLNNPGGAMCETLFGSGVTEFKPKTWSSIDSYGDDSLGPIHYRGEGKVVWAVPESKMFNFFGFEFASPDRMTLVGVDRCTLVRAGAAAPSATTAPPGNTRASFSANAKEARYPETGDVFISFQAPEGWATKNDEAQKTLELAPISRGKSAQFQRITIGVIKANKPFEMTAAGFNKVMDQILQGINSSGNVKAAAFSSKKDTRLSGMTFSSFDTVVAAGKLSFNVKVMACANANNLLVISAIGESKGLTTEHQQVLQSLKVFGVNRCLLNEAATSPSAPQAAGAGPQVAAVASSPPPSTPSRPPREVCVNTMLDKLGTVGVAQVRAMAKVRFTEPAIEGKVPDTNNLRLDLRGSACGDDPRVKASLYDFDANGMLQSITMVWDRPAGPAPAPIFTERISTLSRFHTLPPPQSPGRLQADTSLGRLTLEDIPERNLMLEAYAAKK